MTIRQLSEKTINLIAAGEVVERPASVIKELVENSIDAGASTVTIEIENAGKNFISVSDDGSGIAKDEVGLAFTRHATSKLENDDIFDINSLGFRGEALPSIAAVAMVKVLSYHKNMQEGYECHIREGRFEEIKPSNRKAGTLIRVENLFAQTPARLKFLHSARKEVGQITDFITRISLAHPEVEFKFINDGKLLSHYTRVDNLADRCADILGEEFIANSIEIDEKPNDSLQIKGLIGLPTYSRAIASAIYLNVNGRAVKDKFLLQTIRNSYVNLIPYGRYPVCVLFFEIPNHLVDVNIHPTKQELRFVDEYNVRTTIQNSLRNALKSVLYQNSTTLSDNIISSIKDENQHNETSASQPHLRMDNAGHNRIGESSRKVTQQDVNRYPASASKGEQGQGQTNELRDSVKSSAEFDSSLRRFQYSSIVKSSPYKKLSLAEITSELEAQKASRAEAGFDSESADGNAPGFEIPPLGYAKAQIGLTYIIAENQEELIIVDQHAAHERINLENYKQRLLEGQPAVPSTTLIVPLIIRLAPEAIAALLEHDAVLQRFGFLCMKNGNNEIAIRQAPQFMKTEDAKKMIAELAEQLISEEGDDIMEAKIIEIMGDIVCKKSIKAGDKLSIEGMNALLRQIERTEFSGQCNHGRPTYVKLSKEKLAKLFERT